MTPERRAELRALLVTAPEFIREDPLVRDMPALLDALDAADARERRLREALEEAVEFADQDWQCLTPAGDAMLAKWRAALSEVAPDAR